MLWGSHEPQGKLCYNKKLNKASSEWISGPIFPVVQPVNFCDLSFRALGLSIHTRQQLWVCLSWHCNGSGGKNWLDSTDQEMFIVTQKAVLTKKTYKLHLNILPLTSKPWHWHSGPLLAVFRTVSLLPAAQHFFVGTCFPFGQLSSNTSSLATRHWRAF